jgi:predicted RNase H-like HicB family nuclease
MNQAEIDAEVVRRTELPYTIEVRKDGDGWFARVKELPGCITSGSSREDALSMLDDAMAAWLEAALEDGGSIPEPECDREYSGRFVIRVPQSLHRSLADLAEKEGVSLNQLVVAELSKAMGRSMSAGRMVDVSVLAQGNTFADQVGVSTMHLGAFPQEHMLMTNSAGSLHTYGERQRTVDVTQAGKHLIITDIEP